MFEYHAPGLDWLVDHLVQCLSLEYILLQLGHLRLTILFQCFQHLAQLFFQECPQLTLYLFRVFLLFLLSLQTLDECGLPEVLFIDLDVDVSLPDDGLGVSLLGVQ